MSVRRTPTPFGRAIKIRLCELDLEQKDLARMLGTSSAYVTYLIYGDRRDDAWVERICEALDMQEPEASKKPLPALYKRKERTDLRKADVKG